MNLTRDILEAAEEVAMETASRALQSVLRWGTVTALSPLSVRFDGDIDDTVVGVRSGEYTPSTGDRVVLLRVAAKWVVVFSMVNA